MRPSGSRSASASAEPALCSQRRVASYSVNRTRRRLFQAPPGAMSSPYPAREPGYAGVRRVLVRPGRGRASRPRGPARPQVVPRSRPGRRPPSRRARRRPPRPRGRLGRLLVARPPGRAPLRRRRARRRRPRAEARRPRPGAQGCPVDPSVCGERGDGGEQPLLQPDEGELACAASRAGSRAMRWSAASPYAASMRGSASSGASAGRPSSTIGSTTRSGKRSPKRRRSDLSRRTMTGSRSVGRTGTPRVKRCGSSISSRLRERVGVAVVRRGGEEQAGARSGPRGRRAHG